MHVLNSGPKIRAVLKKQSPTLQIYTKTYMDIWHTTMGHDLPFEHRNFTLSEQSPKDNGQRPMVRTKQTSTHRSADAYHLGRNHEV